ncbi:MAG TPA: DUF1967 domain-containing protein, partial [bacterium]|nr:DUF1967 domain-containing protein [bacterium]
QVPSHNRLVIYEMHVGSFFAEGDGVGTLETVAQQLDRLQRLGVEDALYKAGAVAGDTVLIGDADNAVVFGCGTVLKQLLVRRQKWV